MNYYTSAGTIGWYCVKVGQDYAKSKILLRSYPRDDVTSRYTSSITLVLCNNCFVLFCSTHFPDTIYGLVLVESAVFYVSVKSNRYKNYFRNERFPRKVHIELATILSSKTKRSANLEKSILVRKAAVTICGIFYTAKLYICIDKIEIDNQNYQKK